MSRSDCKQRWEDYFHSLPSVTLEGIEIEAHKQILAHENSRIFSGRGDIEVWQKDEKNIGISSSSLASSMVNGIGSNTLGLEFSGSSPSFFRVTVVCILLIGLRSGQHKH